MSEGDSCRAFDTGLTGPGACCRFPDEVQQSVWHCYSLLRVGHPSETREAPVSARRRWTRSGVAGTARQTCRVVEHMTYSRTLMRENGKETGRSLNDGGKVRLMLSLRELVLAIESLLRQIGPDPTIRQKVEDLVAIHVDEVQQLLWEYDALRCAITLTVRSGPS